MRHVVFGTAGHIDHGKTSLVRALTGIDCDRLPEERQRGITIELGFAHLEEGDLQLHFVDVPGHERLVHTMIAGASGIDLALLVVAADEGIKPQTREHLEVIRLMGVPGGAVALTKADLVDRDLAELAAAEVAELLTGTPFADVPVVQVSATRGDGLDELRRVLVEQARHVRPRQIQDRPFRQAVDRVFTLPGVGTVVTGTSLWGKLAVGQEVVVYPDAVTARVRRLQVHGSERQEVEAGERVAINLVGLSRDELERGDQLLSPGPWQPTGLVTVRLELLASAAHALDEGDEVEIHTLASRQPARVERLSHRPLPPGASAVAQLSLREPLLLFPGDRLVLRRPAPVNTFAGAQVLDGLLGRWRRRDSTALDDLPSASRGAWPELLESWIRRARLAAPTAEALAARLGVLPDAVQAPLGRLLSAQVIAALPSQPPRFVVTAELEQLTRTATAEIGRRLADEEVSAGIPARDFIHRLLPGRARDLASVYLEVLKGRGALDLADGRVVAAGTDGHMTSTGQELTARVDALYREAALDPPSPQEVAERLSARPAAVEGVCRFLHQKGQLVRLDGKYLIHRLVLDRIGQQVGEWNVESFGIGEFKDRFGLTRKLAIPILEWLDSQRVTVRQGDRRRVLRKPATSGPGRSAE